MRMGIVERQSAGMHTYQINTVPYLQETAYTWQQGENRIRRSDPAAELKYLRRLA